METMTANNPYEPKENKAVAYASDGQPLTRSEYQERVAAGMAQCAAGQCKTLEEVCEETGHIYAEL